VGRDIGYRNGSRYQACWLSSEFPTLKPGGIWGTGEDGVKESSGSVWRERWTSPAVSSDIADGRVQREICRIDHCARAVGEAACLDYLGPFDTTRQIDLTAVLGVGIARTLGRAAVHVGARYGLGMIGVDGSSPRFRQRAIAVNVGVSYALQR
jgi:hypothetical protein